MIICAVLAGAQIITGGAESLMCDVAQRKRPSGAKTDRIDAWSLADAPRMDGHAWRSLPPIDPFLSELRQLCRDEIALVEERTGFDQPAPARARLLLPDRIGRLRQLGAAFREKGQSHASALRCLGQPWLIR